jgi:peptide-methionine (S)-S-oxide reductase
VLSLCFVSQHTFQPKPKSAKTRYCYKNLPIDFMMKIQQLSILVLAFLIFSCNGEKANSHSNEESADTISTNPLSAGQLDTAYFAGGCFWCVEASFEQIKGVHEVISGYSGGEKENPTYKDVSYGRTNHAEAVQVLYDPNVITYETLLDVFFTAHDPTQLNRQGPDVGEQYRSAIFYRNDREKNLALKKINELSGSFDDDIVTEITAFTAFWKAEDYHQDYIKNNPATPYITNVSKPKIEKVAKKFSDRLKQ